MHVIGIDPGVRGAIALIRDGGHVELHDMPVVEKRVGKRLKPRVDPTLLASLLEHMPYLTYAFVEAAQAARQIGGDSCPKCRRPLRQAGLGSTFASGVGYGMIRGVLAGMEVRTIILEPAAWKAAAGLTRQPKDASRARALELYPQVAEDLRLKKYHGRAEALLIAHVGLRLRAAPAGQV